MKKIIALLLTLIIAFSLLTSCKTDGETLETTTESTKIETTEELRGTVIAQKGATNYTLVYDDSSVKIKEATQRFVTAFAESTGAILPTDTQLSKPSQDDGYEKILLGKTENPSSKNILAKLVLGEFRIKEDGKNLVILGETDVETAEAVDYFIEKLLSEKKDKLIFTAQNEKYRSINEVMLVSIFGDSISTYQGVSNNNIYNETLSTNPVFYTSQIKLSETWWMRAIEENGWKLCVNNSYSGGRVTGKYVLQWGDTAQRAKNLHNAKGIDPDVIIVYYGINDYNNSVDLLEFKKSYSEMLENMKLMYPDTAIYCGTLIPTVRASSGTTLTQNGSGVKITSFNETISNCAGKYGATIIDFYTEIGDKISTNQYSLGDAIHPNAEGMKLMTNCVSKTVETTKTTK